MPAPQILKRIIRSEITSLRSGSQAFKYTEGQERVRYTEEVVWMSFNMKMRSVLTKIYLDKRGRSSVFLSPTPSLSLFLTVAHTLGMDFFLSPKHSFAKILRLICRLPQVSRATRFLM